MRLALTHRQTELTTQRRVVMQKLPHMMREYIEQMDVHLLNSNLSDAEQALRLLSKMLQRRKTLLARIDIRLKVIHEKLTAE